MSGYRQHGFDPNMHEQPGAPLRPYNKVQWLGVAIASVGGVLAVLEIAALLGWLPRDIDVPSSGAVLALLLGVALINSRRGPGTLVGSEQHDRNRRVLLITLAIVAAILGAAAIIEFTGA